MNGRLVILLKVAASAILLAATVGMFWHEPYLADFWAGSRPAWFATIADGWYPTVVIYTVWLLNSGLSVAAIYFCVVALCVLALFAAPFVGNAVLRMVISAILVGGIAYDLIMYDIGGGLPTFDTTETVLSNVAFGFEGTAQLYLAKIASNLALAAAAFVIFCLPPPMPRTRWAWLPAALVAAATMGVIGIYWKTGGYTKEFPSPFTSYLHIYKFVKGDANQAIAKVSYRGSLSSSFSQIVLIVDESVRADYLSLNNASIDTTPFLVSKRNDIANFGVAVALANCSHESRLALRFGFRDLDLGQSSNALRTLAPFWEYAKQAGFETVHIDTFGTRTLLTHGMTRRERELVDDRIVVNDKPQYVRDEVVANKLRQLIFEPTPKFIFVEKYGVHVPYDRMYPPSANVFNANTAVRFDLDDRANLVRHYENAVRWSVDRFFSVVLKDGVPPNTLILYTSDHGQTLSETRIKTHCNQGGLATKGEAEVPLFAIASNAEWKKRLSDSASVNFDRVSHVDIFPTLLAAMGYDKKWLSEHFDFTLMDKIPDTRKRRFWASGSIRVYDADQP